MRNASLFVIASVSAFSVLAVLGCGDLPRDNDTRAHFTKPAATGSYCRSDEVVASFTSGADEWEVCTPIGCTDADSCPTVSTGNAVPSCYVPTTPGLAYCRLRCAGGETCPTGMECVASADGNLTACAYPTTLDAGP